MGSALKVAQPWVPCSAAGTIEQRVHRLFTPHHLAFAARMCGDERHPASGAGLGGLDRVARESRGASPFSRFKWKCEPHLALYAKIPYCMHP